MASFLVESYAPDLSDAGFARSVNRAREAAEALRESGVRVRHLRSYVVPEDEMSFHVFEAASVDEVLRAVELAGIALGRVVEAVGVRSDP
ncbi:MAG TPA: hypothetical protein VI409_00835 [Gaiellaceae bacterium]|nr:hypothetical protein [Gaiellaceae bacterium]